jgi:arginyl-tRNA--protein-N-Asp/Glu arginylyltransferase
MLDYLLTISDSSTQCSYLPGRTARLPMCLPVQPVSGERFDQLMELGYRRSGVMFYRTQCPGCQACEALRLDVHRFCPNRSQKRVSSRASGLRFELSEPTVDSIRVQLFNLHRKTRGLVQSDSQVTLDDYQSFLMGAPNLSFELSVWHDDRLLAVSITDWGATSLSAVYCFFDPAYSRLSLGTLCILKQIELAQINGHRWLYLGFYVAENSHLSYKANFQPHQRRVDGIWVESSDLG